MAYTATVTMCDESKSPVTAIFEPFEYNAITSTLVDSARNAQGYAVGAVIREDVAKIEMKWDRITPEEWSKMLKCFNSKYSVDGITGNFYRYVRFLNQTTNEFEVRKFYVSDRKAGIARRDPNTGAISHYVGASFSLVEV